MVLSRLRSAYMPLIALGVLAVLVVLFLFVGWPRPSDDIEYGMTFSRPYARNDLSLDPDAVLTAALDDLGIRRFRIPAYWSEVEPEKGKWRFDELDRDIDAIASRGGKIILAVGEKLPRWPECWGPSWWKDLPREEQRRHTFEYIETIVNRYKNNSAIIMWQIENEPHFAYGDCPDPDLAFVRKEAAFVRTLDSTRPIVTTDSGELSLWAPLGRQVDKLGVSVYRVIRKPTIGVFRYWFFPPHFYKRKGMLTQLFGVNEIYVSEFQMEPWHHKPLAEASLEEQFETFDIEQMRSNFRYAERMGITPIDFWGVEWWYWMKEKHGRDEFWEEAKRVFDR